MQTPWQTFLDQLGAVRKGDVVEHFHGGNNASVLVGDHLSIIQVRGDDTEKFLQGQLTCDFKHILAGETRLAMHLSLKGRGMSSFRVLPAPGGMDLVTPRSHLDDALKALKKYAMFSKVTLELDAQRVPLLFLGDAGYDLLHGYDIPVPQQPKAALFAEHTSIARLENGQRYLLLIDHAHAQKMLQQIPVAELGAAQQWQLNNIAAGEGHLENGGQDLWLPQILNYDVLDGVNFKKGCYLGQEIVARMHFKGQLKQRMHRLNWPREDVAVGDTLRNEDGKAVGEVVAAVSVSDFTEALVVLRLDHQGPLFFNDKALQHKIVSLPYRLPA